MKTPHQLTPLWLLSFIQILMIWILQITPPCMSCLNILGLQILMGHPYQQDLWWHLHCKTLVQAYKITLMLTYIFSEDHPLSQNTTILHSSLECFQHSSLIALVVLVFLNMTHQFHLGLRLNICWNCMIHLSGGIVPSCLLLSTFISATSLTYTWLFQSERKSLSRLLRNYQ